jgi:predicted N-formylglutamate amidohydrolase
MAGPSVNDSFVAIEGGPGTGLILLADHASNKLPGEYGTLGLSQAEFERHIAYDIGVEAVTRGLAAALGCPALMTRFSRLLIDPNRGADDPTLIMRISDGAIVPANARIGEDERARRIARFYRPYHDAIASEIDGCLAKGLVPALVSIHSFTPFWKGTPRPWHIGILWEVDRRLSDPLLAAFSAMGDLVVGDNEPYAGNLEGDTLNVHGLGRGLAHVLIEIRQDLIATQSGVDEWVGRLSRAIKPAMKEPALHLLPQAGSGL